MFAELWVELLIIKINNHSLQNMIEIREYDLLREKKRQKCKNLTSLLKLITFFSATMQMYRQK